MRKQIVIALALLFPLTSSGQNRPENALLLLNGGNTKVRASFFWQLLSNDGMGLRFKSAGNWDVWDNPAGLIAFQESYVGLAFQPAVRINPGRYVDIPGEIRSQVNQNIADYRVPETVLDYPALDVRVGQQGGLYGLQIAYPLRARKHPTVLSFELSQPFYLDLAIQNDGVNLMLEATREVSGQKKIIHMRVNAILHALLNVQSSSFTVGFARQLSRRWALGLRWGKDYARARLNAQARVDGIMETAGTEYVFNDPTDPRIDFDAGETNRLDQRAHLDFSGSGWHLDLGMLYRANRRWSFGWNFRHASAMRLSGAMEVEQYKIPALNVDALLSNDEDVSLLDASKLNLAKLTLTEPVANKTSDHLILNRISVLGLQSSFQNGSFELSLSLQKYFGQFGYRFLGEQQAIRPGAGFGLGLSAGIFSFSFGAMHAALEKKLADGTATSSSLWIPHGRIALSSFIFSRYLFETGVYFSPAPVAGMRLGVFL
ncbi:MAG TPA: hypothetical protein ENJ23_01210 [Bacteroidetes bacterium]|nr:hypothetical protein [Bacteroidota bacterium]